MSGPGLPRHDPYLPFGAENDPRAPYNQEIEEDADDALDEDAN